MHRFTVVAVLLACACLFAPSARATGVATCASGNVEGLGMFYCSSSWAWAAPAQVSSTTLVLTCTTGATAGVQNMATCAYAGKSKWVKRSALNGTELVGFCAQDKITPWEACDAPNGKEGWLKASDAFGTSTTPPATDPPASTPPPSGTFSVTLSWSAVTQSTDGTGAAVANYRIEYGVGNFNTIANTASTGITLTNLAAGTWQFRITAISSSGGAGVPSGTVTHAVGSTGGGGTTTPPPAQTLTWMVARNGSASTRTVYEAVLPSAGTTMIRGNTEGTISVGRTCGNEVLKQGTDSYREVTEGEVTLASPTYTGRKHVAVCTQQ